jgi:hypothetical protein
MLLILDRKHQLLVLSEGMLAPQTFIEGRRGDGENIELVFLDDGAPVTPTGLEEFRFVAKPQDTDWDSAAHALASTWVRNTSTGRYQARVNYNTTLLNALLLIASTVSNENEYVDLDAQLAWRTSNTTTWWRSQRVTFRLHNSVWRGNETDPTSGTAEESIASAAKSPQFLVIDTDVVNNNATANTIADITDLEFPVQSGARYHFRFSIPYTAAATSTGARFSITGPASPTYLAYRSDYTLTASTRTTNEGLGTFDLPATANATSLSTGNIAIIEGFIRPSADGVVKGRFASEVSSSAITVKAGACVQFTKLD